MPIDSAELRFFRSQNVSDGATNGGRMSNTRVISGAVANLFPAVGGEERVAGSTKYRKMFCKVENDDDLALQFAKLAVSQVTPGDDRITFFAATQIDTQDDIVGSEKQYGGGVLAGNVLSAATVINVLWESDEAAPEDGDLIRITDRPSVNEAGNEEFVRVDGAVTGGAGEYEIPLATPLQNGYSATNTRVSTVYEPLDPAEVSSSPEIQNQVKAIATVIDVTSDDGDIDDAQVAGDAIGSINQLWTGTFTSGTAFNIVGDTVGSVGAGNISGGAAPNNPGRSRPYFVIPPEAFSGTWQNGDVFILATTPAAVPIWVKRVVPPGADAISSNTARILFKGETGA